MKKIEELIKLYDDFFKALSEKLNKGSNDRIVGSEEFERTTDVEIEELEQSQKIKVPEDIKVFWKNLKTVYTASCYEAIEWEAGWDFIPLDIVSREIKGLRDLANNYEDSDPLKGIHQAGINLTYEEPILLFNGDPKAKTASIHHLLWDGTSIPEAIAPDFRTFFEHWLATGCFKGRDFDAYYEIVKNIIPVSIPLADNLWLNYYCKQYKTVLKS